MTRTSPASASAPASPRGAAGPGPTRRRYAARVPAAERREQLLDAALAIVLADGFHAVTMDGVARATGVTRPVVYGQFADGTELLSALLDRSARRARDQLARALPPVPGPGVDTDPDTDPDPDPDPDADLGSGPDPDPGADPDELLVAGVVAYLRTVQADPATWTVMLLPPLGAPPHLRELVDAKHREVLRHLRLLLEWGLARRGGPHDLDVDLFARSVLTLAEGAAQQLLGDPGRYPVERFERFVRVLVGALTRR